MHSAEEKIQCLFNLIQSLARPLLCMGTSIRFSAQSVFWKDRKAVVADF